MYIPAGFAALADPFSPERGRRDVVHLQRTETGPQGTFGRLSAGAFAAHVAEPEWLDNVPRKSCIPKGTYRCTWHRSPRYGMVYMVNEVENRKFILMHPGNVSGSEEHGFRTHSRGCLLLGKRRGSLVLNGRRQNAVLVSRPTVRAFFEHMGQRDFDLVIGGIG